MAIGFLNPKFHYSASLCVFCGKNHCPLISQIYAEFFCEPLRFLREKSLPADFADLRRVFLRASALSAGKTIAPWFRQIIFLILFGGLLHFLQEKSFLPEKFNHLSL